MCKEYIDFIRDIFKSADPPIDIPKDAQKTGKEKGHGPSFEYEYYCPSTKKKFIVKQSVTGGGSCVQVTYTFQEE